MSVTDEYLTFPNSRRFPRASPTSFASFEFADPVVGLVELVVQCDESGRSRRHGTFS
jgi:hypothetical protein